MRGELRLSEVKYEKGSTDLVKQIKIKFGEVTLRITLDFDNKVRINKNHEVDMGQSIVITPCVSNEILIG